MKLHFQNSGTEAAQQAYEQLVARYGDHTAEDCNVIVAIGGDGFMLHSQHQVMDARLNKPIFGVNLGTVGFLMNKFELQGLPERITDAEVSVFSPLFMEAWDQDGNNFQSRAINEVSLMRGSQECSHLKISIDGQVKMQRLMADGLMLATPVGSTAYNLSAGGPVIPVGMPMFALTPICAFRPRKWSGALLHDDVFVEIKVLDPIKRPVDVSADNRHMKNVNHVSIRKSHQVGRIMFDRDQPWDDRIFVEQFQE